MISDTVLEYPEFCLEQCEMQLKLTQKKRSKRKQQNKRCSLTVDFVEEQTGDKYKNCDNYKKTKRSY